MRKITSTREPAPAPQNSSAILTESAGRGGGDPPPARGLSPTPQPLPHGMLGRKGNDVALLPGDQSSPFPEQSLCSLPADQSSFLIRGLLEGAGSAINVALHSIKKGLWTV